MLWLSELLLQHHELESFDELIPVVREAARGGEMFFRMDVKPQFADTPEDWEDRLEAAFNGTLE
ncbi:MAG: sulfur relay protein DsrC [Gammaproteobacteria bacterium]|nr:sulfur relay protein DsrC [Gammaproteobacteria bacterium]NIR81670.1 sulfur relay protein DsrC [Gammaproteobacteria bacterium]NIR88237.1 sulfur relay protein DsrC [Gammaproteobacteria bacterium]NIU02776.1 sulfur relay protein DsrC [Gammaproteobacteria bacterium]NIV73406.1 sulfur relay protein DsrC [Gammaproteobacteria bacterium]